MAEPEEPHWLKAFRERDDKLHDEQTRLGSEGVKAVLAINGGAAIALLAVYSRLTDTDFYLQIAMLVGLILFALAVGIAAWLNFSRVEALDAMRAQGRAVILAHAAGRDPNADSEFIRQVDRTKRENKLFRRLLAVTFVVFAVAVLLLSLGGGADMLRQ